MVLINLPWQNKIPRLFPNIDIPDLQPCDSKSECLQELIDSDYPDGTLGGVYQFATKWWNFSWNSNEYDNNSSDNFGDRDSLVFLFGYGYLPRKWRHPVTKPGGEPVDTGGQLSPHSDVQWSVLDSHNAGLHGNHFHFLQPLHSTNITQ